MFLELKDITSFDTAKYIYPFFEKILFLFTNNNYYVCIMKLTSKEILHKRMTTAYEELAKIAFKKTKNIGTTVTYAMVGMHLGITGQTVRNYVKGKCKNGNGYIIESLIEEFKKL